MTLAVGINNLCQKTLIWQRHVACFWAFQHRKSIFPVHIFLRLSRIWQTRKFLAESKMVDRLPAYQSVFAGSFARLLYTLCLVCGLTALSRVVYIFDSCSMVGKLKSIHVRPFKLAKKVKHTLKLAVTNYS